jgi:hypothetical protein
MRELPILFNTEMVQAILNGRKTCTRRVVKGYIPKEAEFGYTAFTPKGTISCRGIFETDYPGYGEKFFKLPYQKGDVLYVRETWGWCPCWDCGMDVVPDGCKHEKDRLYNNLKKEYGCYMYQASCEYNEYPSADTWHPSIHMPKKAARIWLKVTDVRVERLQEITDDGCIAEGVYPSPCRKCNATFGCDTCPDEGYYETDGFSRLWNSTIKKSVLDIYGWDADPYVWVIEFERFEKSGKENSNETDRCR